MVVDEARSRQEEPVNSYYYELAAQERIRQWHEEAEQARRVRSMRRTRYRRTARLRRFRVPGLLRTARPENPQAGP